jgi:predicted exporter
MTAASDTLPAAVRIRFIAWTVVMLAMLAIFFLRVLPSLRVETDILALLPNAQQSAAVDAALDAFSAELARKQVFLIGSADTNNAKQAALAFAEKLRASQAFANVTAELNGDLQQRVALYLQHRAFLLSKPDAEALRAGDNASLERLALRAAFTPSGLMGPVNLSQDPLGFVNRFVEAQRMSLGRAQLDGSMLVVQDSGNTFVVVTTDSKGSPFATPVQEQVLPAVDAAAQLARGVADDVRVLSSSVIQHAASARQRATAEIAVFGTLELIGVAVLLWTILGALRPLGLAAITLGLASAAALTAVHFLFGTVHILSLVFGSSLIGGVIDYSIHFFADRFRDPSKWTPVAAVKHVGGAILLGLTTTLIGYTVLALVPFPGLKQIAVFCAVGLAVGCGCVLCWYPLFAKPGRAPPPTLGARIGRAIDTFASEWQWTRTRILVAASVGVVILFGITRVHIQDDIRALQKPAPHLVAEEEQVRALLGGGIDTRFFLVTGDSAQAVLETERQLATALDALLQRGSLNFYQAVSDSVPPLTQQHATRQLLSERVYADGGLLNSVMQKLGFPPDAIERRRKEFAEAQTPLALETWLTSPASDATRHLWLGNVGEGYASVITLGGVGDVTALTQIKLSNVQLIDRVASTTEILGYYRHAISILLALIYLAAGVVLTIRFGWRDAPRILLPSMLATAVTIGFFGWFGVPVNLFTLLGLWLALGLGIDYGIFLRHSQQPDHAGVQDTAARSTAVLSITLSACTTLLAFGLLAFSATPFIRSIGLTLLCAIMLSWLFVLVSCLTTGRKIPTKVNHG